MFNYVWPVALVILSIVVYQICAKSVPKGIVRSIIYGTKVIYGIKDTLFTELGQK